MTFADYAARRDPVFERAVALAAERVAVMRRRQKSIRRRSKGDSSPLSG
jgi:hypothetical protein